MTVQAFVDTFVEDMLREGKAQQFDQRLTPEDMEFVWQDRWNNSRTVPGLETSVEPMHPVCFKLSEILDRLAGCEIAMERDPEWYTIPGGHPNELRLTADDCALLWGMGIGF